MARNADGELRATRSGARGGWRRWLRGAWLATQGAALLALAGSSGCPEQYLIKDDPLELSLRGAAPGTTVQFELHWPLLPDEEGAPAFDVTANPDENAAIGRAPRPAGIDAAFGPRGQGGAVPVELTIAADAPLGPVYFRAASVHLDRDVDLDLVVHIYSYAVSPAFQIFTGPVAPSINGVNPDSARRNSSVAVAFHGVDGIEEPFTVAAADPGVEVETAVYDSQALLIRATLRIQPTARTGDTWFALTTAAGNRTERVPFKVSSQIQPPTLSDIYPNVAESPETVQSVLLSGADFTVGSSLDQTYDSSVEHFVASVGQPTYVDSRLLSVPISIYGTRFDNYVGGFDLAVRTMGGSSVGGHFSYGLDDPPPRIHTVNPGYITAGATTRLVITGTNLLYGVDATHPVEDRIEVIGLPSDLVDEPFSSVSVVAAETTADRVTLDVVASEQAGPIHVALRYLNHRNTNALAMTIRDATAPAPVGCGDLPESGADVTATGAGGFAQHLRTTASAATHADPSYTSFEIHGDAVVPVTSYFSMTLDRARADLHVGSVPVRFVTWSDSTGQRWVLDAGTVTISEESATHVALCIDLVLPKTGLAQLPAQIAVTGYVVVSR